MNPPFDPDATKNRGVTAISTARIGCDETSLCLLSDYVVPIGKLVRRHADRAAPSPKILDSTLTTTMPRLHHLSTRVTRALTEGHFINGGSTS